MSESSATVVEAPPTLVEVPALVGQEEASLEAKPTMSKNALKKAAKNERFAALKLERRAREKEAKREKKRILAEKRLAGELDEDDEEEKKRRTKKPKLQFGGTVVVDLGFDDMMNEKEIKSLCSQLAYTHSANRQASFPFSLIFTSLNGRTYDRLQSLGDASYTRWANTKWWSESYDRLWNDQQILSVANEPIEQEVEDVSSAIDTTYAKDLGVAPEASVGESSLPNTSITLSTSIPKDKIVYLTADTEDELIELKPDEVYIIGGIVDHNRYKNLCLNKANESGVRTARLPIGRYLASLPTRKVLTVNQVFEILVKWVETKDWEESLYSVIPKRKFVQGGKGGKATSIDETAIVEGDASTDEVLQEVVDDKTS
ncbi:tRNA (guanine(9)-N1)-methyltransferase [Psilocybe cubensis]|uniref:tRNA (guanine(9)-N1)-methyltransferase n=2 Tax=Psilocybe cubensis TaxID=181762 RepID=A0A8H7Y0H3_PSICU|nr:tRNA (guanine(9)-N1)-methyltransferase [Psilocybe cubensis]KAH9482346.1 tRNA (guanine(9)-N1)-methyltransferase [Psilocybe cubensis]